MKITHILGAILFGFGVYCSAASMVAKPDPQLEVRIYNDRPCTLTDEPGFKGAEVMYQGKTLKACWAASEDKVFIGDEDGDSGYLPIQIFKRDPEV